MDKPRGPLCKIEDGVVSFATTHGQYRYEFELSEVESRDQLAEWLSHLAAKRWFTVEHMRWFMDELLDGRRP